MIGKRLKYFIQPRTGKRLSFLTKQYFIFSDGRCFDNSRKMYLKQHEQRYYLSLALKDDEGKWHTSVKVHDLVATCFIRLLEQGEQVHHINHDRRDNRLENLLITSASEHQRMHILEKWKNGTMDGVAEMFRNVGISKPAKQVAQLSLDGRLLRVWPSTCECGRNGFDQRHISACCRGERKFKTHKNYRWQYLSDYLAQQPTKEQQFSARQIYLNFTD